MKQPAASFTKTVGKVFSLIASILLAFSILATVLFLRFGVFVFAGSAWLIFWSGLIVLLFGIGFYSLGRST
jgi:hypothetical protein